MVLTASQTCGKSSETTVAPRPICHCLNITESEVRQAIDDHDLKTVRSVSVSCGAGSGCMSCHRHIRRLLNEAARSQNELTEVVAGGCSPQFAFGS